MMAKKPEWQKIIDQLNNGYLLRRQFGYWRVVQHVSGFEDHSGNLVPGQTVGALHKRKAIVIVEHVSDIPADYYGVADAYRTASKPVAESAGAASEPVVLRYENEDSYAHLERIELNRLSADKTQAFVHFTSDHHDAWVWIDCIAWDDAPQPVVSEPARTDGTKFHKGDKVVFEGEIYTIVLGPGNYGHCAIQRVSDGQKRATETHELKSYKRDDELEDLRAMYAAANERIKALETELAAANRRVSNILNAVDETVEMYLHHYGYRHDTDLQNTMRALRAAVHNREQTADREQS